MKKLWENVFLAFVLKGMAATAVACALLLYLHRPVTKEVYWKVVLGTGGPAMAIILVLAIVLTVRSWKRE